MQEIIKIELPISKSVSNRQLIIQSLRADDIDAANFSVAEDSRLLIKALQSKETILDLELAGTAFRFLTAYFAIKKGMRVLTGNHRMKERPIAPLVEALRSLGAEINYLEKQGYPPIEISGKELQGGKVSIAANISSQFITALLLIAPYLKEGLILNLEGVQVSMPYIEMTVSLMQRFGAQVLRDKNNFHVFPGEYTAGLVYKEKDWSSAAFFYLYFSLNPNRPLLFEGLSLSGLQGDEECVKLFKQLGINSSETPDGILVQQSNNKSKLRKFDLLSCPDLIPAFAIAASISFGTVEITGSKTLGLKESDRVKVLQEELGKVGFYINIKDPDTFVITAPEKYPSSVTFNAHGDHRIAMVCAMLSVKINEVRMEGMETVSKSFPNFWNEYKKLGLKIE